MPAPKLTDEQINTLLGRVIGTPEAEEAGLVLYPDESHPCGPYVFVKGGSNGHHSTGDFVVPSSFRSAVDFIVSVRGNLGDDREMVDTYWAIVKRPHEEWSTTTVISLAGLAPLCGVMDALTEGEG